MAISFDLIPSTLRVPGSYAEIDDSRARKAQGTEVPHVLLIGTRLSSGSAAEGELKEIIGTNDGDAYFGAKSQLGQMCRAFKRLNKFAKCTALALNENAGGTAATSTFAFTGTATADGSLTVRIGDQRVTISVLTGDTATAVGAALSTAINATERLIVSSSASTGTVTLTCRHRGLLGNDVTLEYETAVAGIACTATSPSNGATNPDMQDAIDAFADERYDIIVTGFTDDTNMDLLETEMARRWEPLVAQPGKIIAAYRGTHGTLTTYGNARNSQYSCVMGSGLSPTPSWIVSSQVAARDALRLSTQPNRPRNGMTLPDVEAPKLTDQFLIEDRNLLLFDGISTYKVNSAGDVLIERLITTYQTNASSIADDTYLSVETISNLAYLYLSSLQVASKYDDFLLAPDNARVDPGVAAISPKGFKADLLGWYETMERAGFVSDFAGFKEDLIVEINETNPERLDVQMMPRLVSGKVVTAIKISFQL